MTYEHMFPGLDPYYAGPAQPLTTAGEELDDLDHDLSDLSEVCNISGRYIGRTAAAALLFAAAAKPASSLNTAFNSCCQM